MTEPGSIEEGHTKEETVTFKKSTLWKLVSGVLAILLLVSVFTGGFGITKSGSSGTEQLGAPTGGNAPTGAAIADIEELLDDDAVLGDEDAPVTIVEFSDYECPFCGRFYQQTLPSIKEEYIKTGKVKLIYRDFPLSFHPQAQKAAEAAECAGEQDKYWQMHDKLFTGGVQGGITGFKQYAQEIGLDTTKFNQCLDSGAMAAEVQRDFVDGQRAEVQGTPAFFVNGQLVSGAQPFSVFQQIIEAELSN